MMRKYKMVVAVSACCIVLAAIYYSSIPRQPIILGQLDVPLICGGGELGGPSLTLTVRSNDFGKTIVIESKNETAVSLEFKHGSLFGERFANANGQSLEIYDGNFDVHKVFRNSDIYCEMN